MAGDKGREADFPAYPGEGIWVPKYSPHLPLWSLSPAGGGVLGGPFPVSGQPLRVVCGAGDLRARLPDRSVWA